MAPAHPHGYVKARCFGGLQRGSEAQNWRKIGAEGIFLIIIIIIIVQEEEVQDDNNDEGRRGQKVE